MSHNQQDILYSFPDKMIICSGIHHFEVKGQIRCPVPVFREDNQPSLETITAKLLHVDKVIDLAIVLYFLELFDIKELPM